MIDIEKKHLQFVKSVFKNIIPEVNIWVFGSRIKNNAKKHSDLDLVLIGKEKIDQETIDLLNNKFSESDLPFIVDIIDWNNITDSFKKIILENYVVLEKNKK